MTDLLDRLRTSRRRRPRPDRRTPTSRRTSSTGPAPTTGRAARRGAAGRRPRRWPRSSRPAPRAGVAVVPQGGNTGLVGGGVPDDIGQPGRAVAGPDAHASARSTRSPAPSPSTPASCWPTCRRRPQKAGRLFPMSLGSEGSCTIGGNLVDQRRRHRGAALRHDPRAGARPRGRAARRPRLGRAARAPQGQHRLRPHAAVHRLRGHPRRDHRRGAAALPGHPAARHGLGRRARPSTAAVALLGLAQQHAGAHLATFEIANRQALDLVLAHLPGAQRPARRAERLVRPGRARRLRRRRRARRPPRGRCSARPSRPALAADAAIAGSPAQRSALWALREGISEVQKVEGATLKHDVTLPIAELADVDRPRSGRARGDPARACGW